MTATATKTDAVTRLEELLKVAEANFSPARYTQIVKMYEAFAERVVIAPAAGVAHYHNAYAGGYLDHILDVIKASFKVTAIVKDMGGEIDYTKEELVFSAMHHDLGKVGDLHHPYYIPNPSEWHIEHRGEIFAHNEKIQSMRVTERALFLLQQFEIPVTQKEWLAIRLSDGLYDDSSKYYLISYRKDPVKTNLPYVIHFADHISTLAERDRYRMTHEEKDLYR